MATSNEIAYVANGLVALAHQYATQLPGWEQGFIPWDKVPAAMQIAAQKAINDLDAYRAAHPAFKGKKR